MENSTTEKQILMFTSCTSQTLNENWEKIPAKKNQRLSKLGTTASKICQSSIFNIEEVKQQEGNQLEKLRNSQIRQNILKNKIIFSISEGLTETMANNTTSLNKKRSFMEEKLRFSMADFTDDSLLAFVVEPHKSRINLLKDKVKRKVQRLR